MSDSDNKPTLGRKPLGLKTAVQAGEVKQTFSHGRTNKVVVEVKRRKVLGKPGEVAAPAPVAAPEPVAAPAPVQQAPAPKPGAHHDSEEPRQATDEERIVERDGLVANPLQSARGGGLRGVQVRQDHPALPVDMVGQHKIPGFSRLTVQ